MRRPLIAGNWKLHKTLSESVQLAEEIKAGIGRDHEAEVVVAPVFTALTTVGAAIRGSAIALAAQNCYPEAQGAFTGEVSPLLLKDAGCRYVILGHSERRRLFNESDSFINAKIKAVTGAGLIAIFCIGETLEERLEEKTFDVLSRQVRGGLQGIGTDTMARLVIAYEPVWAIGTGKNATAGQAQEVHGFLRDLIASLYDAKTSEALRILYGGSVKPDNAAELLSQKDIDGALVGGASLKASDFLPIVRFRQT
ncbi:MAG: triose-phosphate isomerase [Deltaproteobacteria bacterium]|nr:triose-phosphate isomerase [Deltaproteobacteria bacterium]